MRLERRWLYDDVVWGSTLCEGWRCANAAEGLFEGVPLCIGCADDEIDRLFAADIAEAAGLPNLLPPLWDS